MAKSDSYNDLDELVDGDDELSEQFDKAASHLQSIASRLDNNTLALLYGYYKQANEGKCLAPKPGFFDAKGRYKWEAWNKLGDMPPNQAKTLYIETVKRVDSNFKASENKREGWVTVSTMSKAEIPSDNPIRTLSDYVKDDDLKRTGEILKSYGKERLAEAFRELDEDGLGLVHWAADRGSLDILRLLLSLGADVNLADTEGQTPLHYAATCGHENCVGLLLEYGADPRAVDVNGDTPADVCGDAATKALFS